MFYGSMSTDWRNFFPEESPRPIQVEILDFITTHFDEVDAFFVEAPPGVGKSAIAVCLARWYNARTWETKQNFPSNEARTYITTTTVALEDQYVKSYKEKGLKQLHSSSHYPCTRLGKKALSCEEGGAITKSTKRGCPGYCPYAFAKAEFAVGSFGIANISYILTESCYQGKLGKRGLLIADEGHTLCESICNFLEFRITPKSVAALGLHFPVIKESRNEMNDLVAWLIEEYKPRLSERLGLLRVEVENRQNFVDDPVFAQYAHDVQKFEAEAARLNAVLNNVNPERWVLDRSSSKRDEFFSLTPVTAKGFSGRILAEIAPKIILLSATLIDFNYHRDELEINPERLGIFQSPSPFPKENRPIFSMPYIKLDYKNIASSCKDAAQVIFPILERHENQRGIIFVSSYDQAHALKEELGLERIRTHEGSGGKKLMLMMHENNADSVIISPSLHEGVDLKGDLSRFQILCKLPFPSLFSKIVKRKMEISENWYNYQTVLKIIQSTGRSIRTEIDTAETYILDKDWEWFYPRNARFFPPWWTDALIDL
jgi:ATP-dependent DNA helicase DinG